MKYLLVLALILFVGFRFKVFFAKFWLAFVSPLIGRVDGCAEAAIVKEGQDRAMSKSEADEVRSNEK